MTAAPIRLGPFELLEPIASGGMAEVWRGVHRGQDVPVAIKVVTHIHGREERFLTGFRAEVQAMARLDHPGIVMVLEHGEVSEAAEEASMKRLRSGSPYLAMELASLGSLDRLHGGLPWPELSATLLALLDALGHAHARGVIHRDLKPGNVLVAGPGDLRPGLKLTDFGIAHAMGGPEPGKGLAAATSGTPLFMAPEQFNADWREYGPWTDLYGLGCVAHVLSSGRPPFNGERAVQLAYAHCNHPPPPLAPTHPVPRGFEPWVNTLLAKDPKDRFRRAADAACALAELMRSDRSAGNPQITVRRQPLTQRIQSFVRPASKEQELPQTFPELDQAKTVIEEAPASPQKDLWEESVPTTVAIAEPTVLRTMLRSLPPFPETWRTGPRANRSLKLVGAGLSLYGLRSLPMVDREALKDQIWRNLGAVRKEGMARALLLLGAAGNGKSRLADWVAERADEVGTAIVLKASHGPTLSPADGLRRMLGRFCEIAGLPKSEVRARLERVLPDSGEPLNDFELAALTELLAPTPANDSAPRSKLDFSKPEARHRHVLRFLSRLASERPVVVILEDAPFGADGLTFVIQALRDQELSPAPLLFLLTARTEAMAERPEEAALVAELLRQPAATSFEVQPLDAADHLVLVEELLSLEPELAKEVSQRTNGNPLFAVQLVGDWVQRGVLELGPRGFRLIPGERAPIPDDIHEVWSARVRRVLARHPESALTAIEIAAVLGNEIDNAEWRDACAMAGVTVPAALVLDLIASRLAEPRGQGWMFSHAMARESIERSGNSSDRWSSHHRTAAAMLTKRNVRGALGFAERIGQHLMAAGDLEPAIGPLLAGARERWDRSDYGQAIELLELREQAMGKLRTPRQDPRWGEGWVLRAAIESVRGRFEESWSHAERTAKLARIHFWTKLEPEAYRELAVVAYERGQHRRARELYGAAHAAYAVLGDQRGLILSAQGLGDVSYRLGDLAGAEENYQRALASAEKAKVRLGMADALWGLGYVALWRNDLGGARASFERQRKILEDVGNQLGMARCHNSLGEVARLSGDLAGAQEHYRNALAIHRNIGSTGTLVCHLNLALVRLLSGDYAGARKEVELGLSRPHGREERGHLAMAYAQLLSSDAEDRDFVGWDRHFEEAKQILEETGLKDGDVAASYQLAGHRALLAGEPKRARSAWTLAESQWSAIGRTDKAQEVGELLAGMGG